MKEHKVGISDKSVASVSIPSDFKQAIVEYIWNGYDAQANEISINFVENEVGYINSFEIVDNGTGIDLEKLTESFGAFLDSPKSISFDKSSYIKGKKGKGRFAFAAFAQNAEWETAFEKEGKLLEYKIQIESKSKDKYFTGENKISKKEKTGTTVNFTNLIEITGNSLNSDELISYLTNQFSWFLFLNRERDYSLKIKSNYNEHIIDYNTLIADFEEKTFTYSKEQNDIFFKSTYIRWKEKIGDDFYYYFLNSEKKEVAKEFTSFNRNGVGFFHSFYVQSDYFDSFILSKKDNTESLFEKNRHSPVFKKLLKELNDFIAEKYKQFIQQNKADKLISKYEKEGYFPAFGNNKYEKERKQDLINVVKEIYVLEPKIFEKVKKEQAKTTIGFLNLLLDTDERDNIITIIDEIVNLTKEQRKEFANILKKSKLSNIVKTIKLIENRFNTVEILRKLVFDLKKFTNERDHIQKAVEENYWLFGEQFHLVSADRNFEFALKNYLHIVDEIPVKEVEKIKMYQNGKFRRPDIFMCRKRNIDDPEDFNSEIEENIIIELKRPTVTIGKTQFRQIDDYLDFIVKEERFNSQTRLWKLFVVSNNVDDYIKKQYDAFKDKGKRFLVYQSGNYEIYAMTWDDVFRSFEIKHRYLLDKLDYDKNMIQRELEMKGIDLNKQSSTKLVSKLTETKMN